MKSKTTVWIMRVLFVTILFALALNVQQINPELKTKESEKSSTDDLQFVYSGTKQGENGKEKRARIVEHLITVPEMESLKRKIGVCEEGRNYNQIINGYGTGLRPPTDEEWTEIANKTYVVDEIFLDQTIQSPLSVDHTTKPWFPPIGNQDGEGSCTAWAVGYYMKTFQEAKEHGWNLSEAEWEGGYSGNPSVEYQDRIFSPDFIYHLINHGEDDGSSYYMAINLVCSVGASSWEKMPYDPVDHTGWPSADAWGEAVLYRGNSSGYEFMWLDTDDDLTSLKDWIASDHLAAISVDADKYYNMTSGDLWTLDNYVSPSTNHANTIVGYDDNIEYVEEGQLRHGAFRIANSWGEGGWENVPDGCYWISYETMKQRVGYGRFYRDMIGYESKLVASFRVDHSKRDECEITVGIGNQSSPIQTKRFDSYVSGGDHPFCPNNILFDITEFKDAVPTVYNQSFFLKVYDWNYTSPPTTGTISEFSIEFARSEDTPLSTINNDYVYANVTLHPLETSWMNESLINLDEDFIDNEISTATDSNGYLYVAYEDWYPAVNQQAVFVRRSTDGGNTWSIIVIGYDSTHNLRYPSIAVDPYNNNIFVAVEREWTSSDHDILVLRYVDGVWGWSSVANVLGSDDRFPSITSEYQYGLNWQYISYEYVYTYDDRDLMFAKSTDHGATWSIKKLHGNWPDYNVHTQTCITNAEGYIYIAYRWGANYDSTCGIRVERSTDFGDTWTQFTDIDGLSNGCSFPSIAATHGGSTVIVAFQYDWSIDDIDVWYSYSIDKGTNWMRGYPLFISSLEDETLPTLTVDGGGSPENDIKGYFHAVCKFGNYIRYNKAHYSNPSSWSPSEFVNERWVGEGLAVTTQLEDSSGLYHPHVTWTDERTRNIYYSTRESRTWTVDDDGPADFSIIQEAINAASPGDTIYVKAGTYYGMVNINKTVSLVGENRENAIIEGAIMVVGVIFGEQGGNIVINGFTIRSDGIHLLPGATGLTITIQNNIIINSPAEGIFADVGPGATAIIQNNVIVNNYYGIVLSGSSNHTISGNIVANNSFVGLFLQGTSYNTLRNNHMIENKYNFAVIGGFIHDIDPSNTINGKPIYYLINRNNMVVDSATFPNVGYFGFINSTNIVVQDLRVEGLLLASTNNSLITRNYITNSFYGIHLEGSSNNFMTGNNVTNNYIGISVRGSPNNHIFRNHIINNNCYGVWLSSSDNTYVSENNVTNNGSGIHFEWASYNTISGNNLVNNECGVWFDKSSNNVIYHNSFVDNTRQVGDIVWDLELPELPSINTWDNGYEGNYWSDYNGTDVDGNGIGDIPYVIDVDNQDNYPLMNPWSPIMGDVNGDGIVDIFDIGSISSHWYPGPPVGPLGYDMYADVNSDGAVDIFDIGIVSAHWGETW